jgi:hypothetical protein
MVRHISPGVVAAAMAAAIAGRSSAAAHFHLGVAGSDAAPCCSWDKCGTCSSTTPYCEASQTNCETDCKGQWCPNGAAGPSGYDLPNICDPAAKAAPQVAFACMDWNVGAKAMTDAAVAAGMNDTHFFGVGSFGSDGTNMGKCYEVELSSAAAKKGLLQVINQGGDVSTGQFDLQMGDGGFGVYNGCASPTTSGRAGMFPGDSSAFGEQYGGWPNRAECSKLPPQPAGLASLPPGEPTLNRLCELGFDMGVRLEGGANVAITSATRVACPAELVKLTGVNRTDQDQQETHGAGTLTRMMDCCKPSAGLSSFARLCQGCGWGASEVARCTVYSPGCCFRYDTRCLAVYG